MATTELTSPAETGVATVTSAIAAAVIGGAGLGLSLQETGRMETVANLFGLEHATGGWVGLLVTVLITGTGFAIAVAVVATGLRRTYVLERPLSMTIISTSLGILYGLAIWAVAVAAVLPLWMEVVVGVDRPIPYVHVPSLVGLAAFGLVVGGGFSALYRAALALEG